MSACESETGNMLPLLVAAGGGGADSDALAAAAAACEPIATKPIIVALRGTAGLPGAASGTAGVSARETDLLDRDRFPVFRTGRGGQFTYHGPGQRVAYVMLDLRKRGRDVTRFVADLERWIIGALDRFNVKGEVREGRVGVWVERKGAGWVREDKIAAIGVRLRRWVSFHGIALNVEPDLSQYDGIVPCGVRGPGVTSLVDLGRTVTMDEADAALFAALRDVFGEAVQAPGDPVELAR